MERLLFYSITVNYEIVSYISICHFWLSGLNYEQKEQRKHSKVRSEIWNSTHYFSNLRVQRNFFPIYIYILIFSLARISSKKGVSSVSDGCTPRWTREKYRHTKIFASVSEIDHLPVLPDKLGKVLTHYFFAIVCQNPKSDMPAPCCTQTQDPNQPPAGRPIPASSGSEMRTCIPILLPLTLSEAF